MGGTRAGSERPQLAGERTAWEGPVDPPGQAGTNPRVHFLMSLPVQFLLSLDRNSRQQRAIEAFRPSYSSVGTVGTGPGSLPQCSDRSDQPANRSEQEKPSVPGPVPTVPTAKHDVADCCRHCGALLPWPGPAGIVLGDGTAECQPCADAEAWRLLEAGRRAVKSPDALADPAEFMLGGHGWASKGALLDNWRHQARHFWLDRQAGQPTQLYLYPSETLPYARSSFSALSRSSSRTVRRTSISSRV